MPRGGQARARARRPRPPASGPRSQRSQSICGRRRSRDAAARFCRVRFGWIQAQALCSDTMKRSALVIFLGSILAASAALATTYVRVEKDGTKTYSDRPLPGGQPVDVQPAQSYSTPKPAYTAPSGLPREQQLLAGITDFRYARCAVTPANDSTFTNPETVNVAVDLAPPLRPGDVLTLSIDGQPVSLPNALSFRMAPVFRGTHTASVIVKDIYGTTLCSGTTSFHVFRPSVNLPGRR